MARWNNGEGIHIKKLCTATSNASTIVAPKISNLPSVPSRSPSTINIPLKSPTFPHPSFPPNLLPTESKNEDITPRLEKPLTNNHSNNLYNFNKSIKHSDIHIYYQNVRGLRTKCKELYLSTSASNFDVIALTETWLNPSFNDNELFHTNFLTYQCDRSFLTLL